MTQHLQPHDAEAATKLVKAILAAGYALSVYDGEAYAIVRSTDEAAILKEVGATDIDKLIVRSADGERIGSITLVYGNSPGETISDHTDNPIIEALVAKAA